MINKSQSINELSAKLKLPIMKTFDEEHSLL